jgi:hypothetical protein
VTYVGQTVGIAEDILIRSKFDVLETEVDRLLELPPADASKGTSLLDEKEALTLKFLLTSFIPVLTELVSILTLVVRLSKEPDVAQNVLVDWTDLATNTQAKRSQDAASLKQVGLDCVYASGLSMSSASSTNSSFRLSFL